MIHFFDIAWVFCTLECARKGVVVYPVSTVVQEVGQRHKHSLRQSPAEAARHYDSIAPIKQHLSELLGEQCAVLSGDGLESVESWLKLLLDLPQEGQTEERRIQGRDLFILPMYHSLSESDTLEIWKKERLRTLHLLKDHKQGQNIEILVVVVLAQEARILLQYEAELRLLHSLHSDDELLGDGDYHFVSGYRAAG